MPNSNFGPSTSSFVNEVPLRGTFDTNGKLLQILGSGQTVAFDPANIAITGGVLNSVPVSSIGTTKIAPYLGIVATKCSPAQSLNSAFQQLQGRTRHVAMDTVKSIQLVYNGWYITNPRSNGNISEINAPATSTLTASIEYPVGTISQVRFAGQAIGIMLAGGALISDSLTVNIPVGAAFFIRVYVNNPVMVIYNATSNASAFGESCNLAASGLADLTLGGTITNTYPQVRFTPSAIIGITSRPSFALFGDSKTVGVLDTYSDGYMLVGELERSIGKQFGFTNLAVGGERVNDVANGQASKRLQLLPYVSHVINQYGINDLSAPRTAAQITADIFTFKSLMLPGKPFVQCTVAPVSTSSDGWATTVNQTTAAFNSARTTLNASVRNCFTGTLDGYIEIADAVETARDSGIWKAPGYTTDGTHETQLGAIAVKAYGGVDDACRLLA